MARAVLVAVLVLCAAAALAHAGRVLQEDEEATSFEASWLQQPPTEAPSPSPYASAGSPSPGGIAMRGGGASTGAEGGGGGSRYGGAIADVLWFVFKWTNDAYAAGGRRKDQ